ncbi:MAG: hypothetical protein KDI62_16480 [Anaerolineae bacterium]|nr:hypothetical protein [Anaerolineae bacterium]MCB9107625.1 hypothetical protein [Anaerolineales bacterium]
MQQKLRNGRVSTSLWLEVELRKALDKKAEAERRSVSQQLICYLERGLKADGVLGEANGK